MDNLNNSSEIVNNKSDYYIKYISLLLLFFKECKDIIYNFIWHISYR